MSVSRENTGRWCKRRGVCKQPRAPRDGHQLHREGGFAEEVIWSQEKKKRVLIETGQPRWKT